MSSKSFDPNAAASEDSGVFGLPYSEKESALIYLPVPWEATTSYGGGTSNGPGAIFEASHQVDLFDLEVEKPYEPGLFFLEEASKVRDWNKEAKRFAQKIIDVGGDISGKPSLKKDLERVNELGTRLNDFVEGETRKIFKAKKIPAIVGGDHSVPFGAIKAAGEVYSNFGILHFDAHSDTRDAFEGFEWSHASIMRNVLDHVPQVKKLVQVGIRDVCEEEISYCREQGSRVKTFYDFETAQKKSEGTSWSKITQSIVSELPNEVWISFDIDGLDPRYCPHTGTPVPGGLEFHEALQLIAAVAKAGKKIIGFDLNEVSPGPKENEWDANVGARMLYKMTAWTLYSQGKAKLLRA